MFAHAYWCTKMMLELREELVVCLCDTMLGKLLSIKVNCFVVVKFYSAPSKRNERNEKNQRARKSHIAA
ncbi:hypothetical protein XpiCFBP4643_09650 [Xanthomonas pisi]|uniref:Uncharacterized protein n=1 Tax=Xanthomonas pisi TaxID=56457 RepID=A0A2S7D4T7_9XANT|nr:hypothetical protein XpiCFBP4643_09650 [Xanthomonas pisi]